MKRVLVIDDDVKVVNQIEEILTADGWEVDKALSGEEGLERARAAAPEVILIDLVMPGTSGFQVCKSIKSEPELEGIPIIMLTLREGAFDPRYTKLFGVVDFLKKPLDRDLLREKVRGAVGDSPSAEVLVSEETEPPVPEADAGFSVAGRERFSVETDEGFQEEDEEGLGADEFAESPDGAMFSAMDDISGISMAPDDSADEAFRSPIRFDEMEAVGEVIRPPLSGGEESTQEAVVEPAAHAPAPTKTRRKTGPAEEPQAEPGGAVPPPVTGMGSNEALERSFREAATAALSSALTAGMPGALNEQLGSALEMSALPERTMELISSAVESYVREDLPTVLLEGIRSLVREALEAQIPPTVQETMDRTLSTYVAEQLPARLAEALGGEFIGGVASNLSSHLADGIRETIEEQARAALTEFKDATLPGLFEERLDQAADKFREETLPALVADGMEKMSPNLDAAVDRAIFRAAEDFLSGKFEDIVAERMGAVMHGSASLGQDRKTAFEADLASLRPETVLRMLETEQATGWLSIVGAEYVVDIHLKEGRIRFASSLAAPTETRLGRILLEKAMVDEDTLILARQQGRKTGKRLGRILVEIGKLTERDLGEVLCDQTRRLTNLVFSLESGRCLFVAGPLETEIEGLPCALSVDDVSAGEN